MNFDVYLEKQRFQEDLQEKKVFGNCDGCKSEIYFGNEYFVEEGYMFCEDCYDEMQTKIKQENRYIAGEDYE